MKTGIGIVLFLAVAAAIIAVAVRPKVESQAYAIQSEANQNVLDREQARQQRATKFRLQFERDEAVQDDKIMARRLLLWAAAIALIALMGIGVLNAGYYARGLSRAGVARAELRARLIPLDEATRQYPVLVDQAHQPRFACNFNTGEILRLTEAHNPNAQMITAAALTQAAGAIAREARRGRSPAAAGAAGAVNPPLVVEQQAG